ncbi:hypothetical protein [Helicobacter cetorum]|uniref:hypothetical protein n=1 Tax=Helicobacter cetorum TaxID=138563 RepID=UPI000CF13B80|nr:hypothetical protein [Helicobacter cetorum]
MFLVKKIGVLGIVLGCFLACSQESFIKMQKQAHYQENDGSKRPSYVGSDYEVFSETIYLQNERLYKMRKDTLLQLNSNNQENAFRVSYYENDEDNFSPVTTSSYLLAEAHTKTDKKEMNHFIQSKKGDKKIEYSQQSFYPFNFKEIRLFKNANNQFFIEVKSNALKQFLKDGGRNYRQRQVQTFAFDNTATQITQFKGKLDSYVYTKNKDNLKLKPLYNEFQLKKKNNHVYMVVGDKTLDFSRFKKCHFVFKKQANDKLDSQHKEISIDLDSNQKARFRVHAELFLECLK